MVCRGNVMKLKSVKIRNFRSIKDITVTFEQRCRVLVGINESGKSNILHALAHLDPEREFTPDDIREIGRDESPGQSATIWFIFGLDANDRKAIYESILGKVYADPKTVFGSVGGRPLTLQQLCDEQTEGLYCVDLVAKTKAGSYWSFEKQLKVDSNWRKPVAGSQMRIEDANGKSHVLTKFAAVDSKLILEVTDSQLGPLTSVDVERLVGAAIIQHVADNLPPIVLWEYREANLLPATVDTEEFTADPNTCLPLKHMFELAGYPNPAEAIADASTRANGFRNLLERVAELTTKTHAKCLERFEERQSPTFPTGGVD